jgi:hypothetical protein
MQDLNYTEETKNNVVSVIKDPFLESKIKGITIRYNGDAIFSKPYWYVKIDFQNGYTKGEQSSPHRESMEEILIDLKQILDSVKNK